MIDRDPEDLLGVLEEARVLGLLGPGPVARQWHHARDLVRGIGKCSGPVLDLGSGAGLPGLVLFDECPEATGVLLDAQRRRCDFLARAIETLGLGTRVSVECGRAEVLARDDRLRGRFGLVVARSFGSPATTAECGVGFLRRGGHLVVTEPPPGERTHLDRWSPDGLARLGFSAPVPFRVGDTGAVRLEVVDDVDEAWPRRDGVPSKRPLW